jgi:alkylated DNA repair protein (DNA oxidative demethylase)
MRLKGADFPAGFCHLPDYFDPRAQRDLVAVVELVVAQAPLYRPTMPRSGRPFSVTMTNCGSLGWVSDKAGGYRYQTHHPLTGRPWPDLPGPLLALWTDLSGYPHPPQACLINHYTSGARLGSHVDADEDDPAAPVISVSLGDTATFHVGGTSRSDPKTRLVLRSGDVVVLAGASRLAYHGIDRIWPGTSDVVARGGRINLTLRRVHRP